MAKKAGASWGLGLGLGGFARRKPVCEIAVIFFLLLLLSVGLRRNKIKCGEEKTPLVFGDIAIVIGGERGERGERGRRQKYANLSRKERKRVPSSPSIVPSRRRGRSLLAREIGGSKTETRFIKSTSKDAPNLFIEITADRGRERGREIKTLCSLPPSADRDCLLCRPLSLSLCISTL